MRLWHRHRWQLESSQAFRVRQLWGDVEVATENKTCFLYRCATCDDVRTKEVRGSWTVVRHVACVSRGGTTKHVPQDVLPAPESDSPGRVGRL